MKVRGVIFRQDKYPISIYKLCTSLFSGHGTMANELVETFDFTSIEKNSNC